MKAKQEYQNLLRSGDLEILYPDLTGEWKKDQKEFTRLYDLNNEALKDIVVEIDDEEGEI